VAKFSSARVGVGEGAKRGEVCSWATCEVLFGARRRARARRRAIYSPARCSARVGVGESARARSLQSGVVAMCFSSRVGVGETARARSALSTSGGLGATWNIRKQWPLPAHQKAHAQAGCFSHTTSPRRGIERQWAPSLGRHAALLWLVLLLAQALCVNNMRGNHISFRRLEKHGAQSQPPFSQSQRPTAPNRADPRGTHRGPSTTQGLSPGSPPHHRHAHVATMPLALPGWP